jgi:uncharacterized protein (DUF2126 family)
MGKSGEGAPQRGAPRGDLYGRRLPLTATGRTGEYVARVGFKAWSLPSALHPSTRRY